MPDISSIRILLKLSRNQEKKLGKDVSTEECSLSHTYNQMYYSRGCPWKGVQNIVTQI